MSFATRMAATDVQEETIATIEGWLKSLGKCVVGGTTMGKYQDTVLLDLTHNGGEIYVHANGWEDTDYGNPGVVVNGIHIQDDESFEEFKEALESKEE